MSEYGNGPDEGDEVTEEVEEEQDESAKSRRRPVAVAKPKRERPHQVLPIGEVETPETLTGSVSITRGIGLGTKQDSVYYKVELPVIVQPGWTPEECAVSASTQMNQAKSVLYEHAGLSFDLDESGVLHEIVRAHFPAAEREPPRPERRDRDDDRRERRDDDRPRSRFPHPADMDQPEGIRDDDWDDLVANYEDYYDNRSDKAKGVGPTNGPDFRHKDSGKGLWMRPYQPANGSRGGNRQPSRSRR